MRDDRADQRGGSNSMLRTFEQVWQLSDIDSDPARFVSAVIPHSAAIIRSQYQNAGSSRTEVG